LKSVLYTCSSSTQSIQYSLGLRDIDRLVSSAVFASQLSDQSHALAQLAHSDFLFDCYTRYTNTLMYVCMYANCKQSS